MMSLSQTQARSLRLAVAGAAGRRDVAEAVGAVYRELAEEVDRRRPVCVMSGRCCRFDEYGQRLYVTTLELAAFQRDYEKLRRPEEEGPAFPAGRSPALRLHLADDRPEPSSAGCPFQVGKLCQVHAIRPFGCRIFFCDATSTQWQQTLYEAHHARLKRLHEMLDVPYFYVEWRAALAAIMGDGASPAG